MKPASELTPTEAAVWAAVNAMGWKVSSNVSDLCWDDKAKRTRLPWQGTLHKARIKLGIEDDRPGDGFVFSPLTDANDGLAMLEAWCGAVSEGRVRGWAASSDGKRYVVSVHDKPKDQGDLTGPGSFRTFGPTLVTAIFAAVYGAVNAPRNEGG